MTVGLPGITLNKFLLPELLNFPVTSRNSMELYVQGRSSHSLGTYEHYRRHGFNSASLGFLTWLKMCKLIKGKIKVKS